MDKPKMIVIGLDGVDWRLLNKFIKTGDLPNLERILEDGASCRMISSIPPLTVPSWINAFTGVNPGKHGIFHFTKLLPSGSIKINTLRDLKVDPVWRILSDYGKKVAIIRFPLGFPTSRDGIYVGGFLAPDIDERCVRPIELIEKLKIIDYPLASNFSDQIIYRLKGKPEKALNYLLGIFKKRARFMEYIINTYKPDFVFNLFDTTDRLLHIYIDCEEIVVRFLKEVDNFIGEILKALDKNTHLIVVSDHGFERIDKYLFPNELLARNGYIRTSSLSKIINGTKFYLLENFPECVIRTFPKYLLERLFKITSRNLSENLVFRNHEIAKFSLAYHIKINPIINGDEYNHIRDQIVSEFNSLKDDMRNKIVEAFKREEVYTGNYLNHAPDIILLVKEGYTISSAISGKIIRRGFVGSKAGDHVSVAAMQNAFFAIYHKEYNLRLNGTAQIKTIAPTILHLMGIPIPKFMEKDSLIRW
ncbi:alkaline phosphatase family protein [Archaeoglobus neptunius]|uniref:alkaline phosphatase family protein n=1 Tax=Archaeoglobus neptunius TaxID=2798580 RepID=UPI001928C822|nr:alkaline phosphatase family protein [Archaeoglobus neptunius]